MGMAKLDAGLLAKKGKAVPFSLVNNRQKPLSFGIVNGLDGEQEALAVRKTLKLCQKDHQRLRLLAARENVSQQQLMEYAVRDLLRRAQENETCICR